MNVFDIQQGVAIGIFVKRPGAEMPARVHYADLWGEREDKYDFLWSRDFKTTEWQKLNPESPFYLFFPQDPNLKAEYERGYAVTDIMPVNNVGFQSHRDPFAIAFTRDEMLERIKDMRGTKLSDSELREKYGLAEEWDVNSARSTIRNDRHWQDKFSDVLYRPFDRRHSYFSTAIMDRPRREILVHVAHRNNLCLNTMRQTKAPAWHHAVVSDSPAPAVFVEIKDGSNLFPLYLYPETGVHFHQQNSLISPQTWGVGKGNRAPNLSARFILELEAQYHLKFITEGNGDREQTFGPEDVLAYIYAVLNCPSYQSRYSDFLKLDFPRVRLVSDKEQFIELASLGMKLIQTHLMSHQNDPPMIPVSFPVTGKNTVHRSAPRFTDTDPKTGGYLEQHRVYINETQYFENVPQEVWEAEIGGYQPCSQWLKDRRGLELSYPELDYYQRLVSAVYESSRIIDEIESVAPSWSAT